ncbi:ATP-binding cassette domain-containing protein [Bdellovibrio sp. HCB2-146]|uniref:ATP-binding cassette domain-containing protein n=1 Tax=Bdellovibrio sp. HCB2-146 TaxID=3394362 RepID=UPI0039BCFC50
MKNVVRTFRQILDFYIFVARNFALFSLVLFLTILLLGLEYAVTSLMIPLASIQESKDSTVVAFWSKIVEWFGYLPSSQIWLWLFFLLMLVRLFVGFGQSMGANLLGRQVHRFLSEKVFGRIVSDEPMVEVYKRSVGFYITLGGDDTVRCGTIIFTSLQCLVAAASALVGLFVLFIFSKKVFLGSILFILVCAILIFFIFGFVLNMNLKSNALSRELNTAFVEALNSLRSLRVLGAQIFVRRSYAQQISLYVRMLFEIEALRSAAKNLPAILLLFCGAIIVWPGARMGDAFNESSFFATIVVLIRIFVSLGQLVSSTSLLLTDIRAMRDISDLIENPNKPTPFSGANSLSSIDRISLVNIKYGYNNDVLVLDNLSFDFIKGKVYAIVGSSGSGKSTLADIILGLVSPQSGSISINGISGDYRMDSGRIMLVEQQVRIFSTSIRENLLLGLEIEDLELWKVLEFVGLFEFVNSLKDKLDTKLNYQGSNLSGGQRQRLGIARALLHRPDVLILDEATSALDQETRVLILTNLRAQMKNGILIFITHEEAVYGFADIVLPIGARLPERVLS